MYGTVISMDILEEVKRIQVARGLNDTQMAELLGYKHRTGWAKIKTGVNPATEVFNRRAIVAFRLIRREWCLTPEVCIIFADRTGDGVIVPTFILFQLHLVS